MRPLPSGEGVERLELVVDHPGLDYRRQVRWRQATRPSRSSMPARSWSPGGWYVAGLGKPSTLLPTTTMRSRKSPTSCQLTSRTVYERALKLAEHGDADGLLHLLPPEGQLSDD